MKNILLLFLLSLPITHCATPPSNPNACHVWSDETLTPGSVLVEGDAAFYGAGCITGRFGCKWKEAKFDGDDIVVEGELAGRTGKILNFKDGKLTWVVHNAFEKAVGGAFSNGESFEFKSDRIILTTKLTGIGKALNRGNEIRETNILFERCTQREAAIGAAFILSGR